MCLNVGVDPPDLVKTEPCARLECWFGKQNWAEIRRIQSTSNGFFKSFEILLFRIWKSRLKLTDFCSSQPDLLSRFSLLISCPILDPTSVAPQKALELIGASLQKQYDRWQPKARYKLSLDPTVDDVKKLCISLRRNAKEERVLFHYNGHGVPKPTQNGEIWVFNRTYTQYIPLSIYDLQTWMAAPSIYVWDCSNAGVIVNSFNNFAEQHEMEQAATLQQTGSNRGSSPSINSTTSTLLANNKAGAEAATTHHSFKNCIQLAACSADQILPMNPDLPADLFTSCLTTPVKTALKWFAMRPTSKLVPHVTYEMIETIPGVLNDRRTMLGELNWIFTAITDTIAWNTLPRELFQTLFRQDLLVASLFRNFLLADRILRSYDCTPISSPALPQTYRHPMWAAWDLALDVALSQLPDILANKKTYSNSAFFEEQLTAFQVWLEGNPDQANPPEQLPIVLQVLLSQAHRIRALELLEKFLDIGGWAVNLALNVGIFPYVLRLLQSPAVELRPYLVFIWAKILAVDYVSAFGAARNNSSIFKSFQTCQVDIVRESVDSYFLNALQDTTLVFNQFDCRTFAAFVLASIVYKFEQGQTNALKGQLLSICLENMDDPNPILRKWYAICLGNLWQNFEDARWSGARDLAYDKLYSLLKDPVPEVRAATVYALGTFISSSLDRTTQANDLDRSIAIHILECVSSDMNPLVRMELVAALQWIVKLFDNEFVKICLRDDPQFNGNMFNDGTREGSWKRTPKMKTVLSEKNLVDMERFVMHGSGIIATSSYSKLWNGIVNLSKDPFPEVAAMGIKVTEHIRQMSGDMAATVAMIPRGKDVICDITSTSGGSNSLPPSPNTRNMTNYMSNSHSGSSARLNSETSSATHTKERPHKLRVPIVKTNFVEWEIASMARPLKYLANPKNKKNDEFAQETMDRKNRFARNEKIRKDAMKQQRMAVFHNLKNQTFIGKTQMTPSIVKLHPYEQQIVVAYLDRIMVNDWALNISMQLSPMQPNSPSVTQHHSAMIQTTTNSAKKMSVTAPSSSASRVSSVQFVNAHDRGLILAGYEDGSVRIWKNGGNNQSNRSNINNNLVTAFQAIEEQSTRSLKIFGLQTAWHQSSQTIIVGGESKVIRLWDAAKELKIQDFHTGSDFPISHISCAPNAMFAVGFGDGSIQIFDRRASQYEKVMTYREHSQSLLTICLRNDCESLISGRWVVMLNVQGPPSELLLYFSLNGDIRLFDIRNRTSVQNWSAGYDVTSISVHPSADIIAWWVVQTLIGLGN